MFDDDWFTGKSDGASSFIKKKKEEAASRRTVASMKQPQPAQMQPPKKNKNLLERAGDFASGVGNFVKEAAKDVKDTTVDTYQGLGAVGRGAIANRRVEQDLKAGRTPNQQSLDDMKELQNVNSRELAFKSAETFLNVATLGVGSPLKAGAKAGAKQLAKKELFKTALKYGGPEVVHQIIRQGGEQAIKDTAQEVLEQGAQSAVKKLAKSAGNDAIIGSAYGVTQTGKNNPDAKFDDYLLNAAYGAGIGAAVPVVGAGLKKGAQKIKGAFQDRPIGTPEKPKADGADLNTIINRTIDEQSDKYGQSVITRVKNWIGDQVDPNRAFSKIDDAYAKANGIKRAKLDAEDSLEDLARRSAASEREAAGLFETKTPTGMSASDLVKKYKGDSPEGMEFNNYANAKFDLEFREKNKGKKRIQNQFDDDELKHFVESYEARNPDAVKDLQTKKAVNDMAVDYMVKSGALSKAEGETIKKSYKYAVPLERVFPDDLQRPQVVGKNIGSIAKQTVIQRLEGGSDLPLSNSFDTMLNRVYKAVSQGNRAKLARKLLERQEQGHINANVVVGAGNKAARIAARDEIRDINKGVRYLQKRISITNRQAKRLDKELADLNISGMKASIKNAGTAEAPKQPIRTVTVKTVKEHIKDNAPKTLDDLNQSYNVKAALQKAYGSGKNAIAQMAADVYNGGWDQLMALNPEITRATAESIAGQILKKPTITAAKTTVKEGKIGRTPSARSVIEAMINAPASEVQRIQEKISRREPKLAAKLDEIINYKTKIDANKSAKQDLKDVIAEFGDDPTTGKQMVSGVIDGETFKMEIPPDLAKAVMGLDQQKLPSVLKALAIAKKPFEVMWTGVLNPVFSAMSFAFYDTPMSVINSPQGFKTLAPKAVVESLKSIKSSTEFQQRLAAEGARPYGGSGASSFVKPDAKSIAAQRSILANIKYSAARPEVALSKLDIWGGKLANMTRTRIARAAYDDALRVAKRAGEDIKDPVVQKRAMENAALAYRTVMPDFDTMSNLTRQINSVVPFFAASVAGTRSFGKALRRDPAGTTAKAMALGIAPTVGVTAFSLMQPAGQDFYRDMENSNQTRLLDDNLVVVLPGAHKDMSTGEWKGIVKIPLAPEFRALNQSVWRSVRGEMGGDGPEASHIALSLFDTVTGGVRTSENPLITTRRILSGEDPRTGEQIIKGDMADLPKEEQIYSTTSSAGKLLGGVLNTSPIQGDKILGQFGLVGQTAKNGGKPVEAVTENVANRFGGAYGQSAANAFYDTYRPLRVRRDRVSREVTDLVKEGRINEARRRAEDFNQTLPGKFAGFNKVFGGSDSYDPTWDDLMSGLQIKTSKASFESRQKQ